MAYKKARKAGVKTEIFINLCILLVGVLFLALGIGIFVMQANYQETTAVITNIESEYDSTRNSTDYTVTVKYEVDGQVYTTELGEYITGYTVGKQIKIKYNPSNPDKIASGNPIAPSILLAFGVIGLLVGLGLSVNTIKHIKLDKASFKTSSSNSVFDEIPDRFSNESKEAKAKSTGNPFDDIPDRFAKKEPDRQEVYREDMAPHEDVFKDEVKYEKDDIYGNEIK